MRVRWGTRGLVACWIALVGCGFETGGVASGSASVGTLEGGTTGASADDDDDDDDGAEMTADDGGVTGAMTTTAGDPSGDPSGDPTTAETTDPTIDPSDGESDTTADDAGATTTTTGDATTEGAATTDPTTDPTGGEYPNCSAPNTCTAGDEDCLEVTSNNMVVGQLCVPPCGQDSDCPPPPNGTATPYCPEEFGIYFCRLDCDGGLICPDGMDCVNTNIGFRCFYPVGG